MFNLKTKYVPQNRSMIRPFLFICLVLITFGLRFLFFTEKRQQWLHYFEISAFILLLLSYISTLMMPRQGKQFRYLNFLDGSVKLKKVCLICIKQKPKRSMHCDICKICIERYDHHCYWINNCVGKHNFKRFIFLIIYLEVFLIAYLVNGILLLLDGDHYL